MIPSRIFYLAMLFAVGISYSLLFSINKLAAEAGLPYVAYEFWHSLGGGLMLLLLCLMMAPKSSASYYSERGVLSRCTSAWRTNFNSPV